MTSPPWLFFSPGELVQGVVVYAKKSWIGQTEWQLRSTSEEKSPPIDEVLGPPHMHQSESTNIHTTTTIFSPHPTASSCCAPSGKVSVDSKEEGEELINFEDTRLPPLWVIRRGVIEWGKGEWICVVVVLRTNT